jgi:hypothetical protein
MGKVEGSIPSSCTNMHTSPIVVCAPVSPVGGKVFDPADAPYSEYSKVRCPHCRQPMWLGARGRAEVESGRAQMMCMVCAVQLGLYSGGDIPKLTDRDP